MKKITFLLILAISAIGCGSDDDAIEIPGCIDPESTNYNPLATTDDGSCIYNQNVTFNFTQDWDGKPVTAADFNTTVYTNEAGNELKISKLRYLISRISLHKADGTSVDFEDYSLIDLTDSTTLNLSPETKLTTGDYTGISFVYGFNEQDNESGAYPDLNAATWNWPEMLGGGYHFMQMEGTFEDNTATTQPYAYHNGTARESVGVFEQNFIAFSFDKNFTISSDTTIEIKMNIAEWYKNPLVWDLNDRSTDLMMNYTAQKDMNKNGESVFSIGDITD